jgi:hypothetical protein
LKITTEPQAEELRILAWQRLAALGRFKTKAINELRTLAQGKAAAATARHALAELGDEWVIPYLRVDLRASRRENRPQRIGQAKDLIQLGDVAEAALLLADRDVEIRSAFSCFVVSRLGRNE